MADPMYDTTEQEQAVFVGWQKLTVSDDSLRGAFALKGDERAAYKDELAARAKATRSMVRRMEKSARTMDIIASLL